MHSSQQELGSSPTLDTDSNTDLITIESTTQVIESNNQIASEAEEDFDQVRSGCKRIISTSEDMLEYLTRIIEDTDGGAKPDYYKSIGSLTSSIIAANKQLLDLQKQRATVSTRGGDIPDGVQTLEQNNFYFNGTLHDIVKAIDDIDKHEAEKEESKENE